MLHILHNKVNLFKLVIFYASHVEANKHARLSVLYLNLGLRDCANIT